MPLTREDFATLSIKNLLLNIYILSEYVRKGNCKDFYNEYIDYCIKFAERQWDNDCYQNFNYVIQMLLHGKVFDFSQILPSNLYKVLDFIKK